MNNHKLFTTKPFGAGALPMPVAPAGSVLTSKHLVSPNEPDAAFFRMIEKAGISLNETQIQAVRHDRGPLLTLAGAGTGKTSVLTCRAAYLLKVRQVDPRQILLVTFTSKAAAEMRERLADLPGISAVEAKLVGARTFHSLFLQVIRQEGCEDDLLTDQRRPHFIMKRLLKIAGLQEAWEPETALSRLSAWKSSMLSPEEWPARTSMEQQLKPVLLQYEGWKKAEGKMDFDDILLEAHKLFTRHPEVLERIRRQYAYIMVDEFQDTNPLQYQLVRMIAEPDCNLMAVGDDDQTIYTFNGARQAYILQFEQQYPAARVITLDVNYRSGSSILGLANEVISHNEERRPKTLYTGIREKGTVQYLSPLTTDHEAEAILEHIKQQVGKGKRKYGDIAILHRTASYSRAFFERLLMEDIPFVQYGNSDLFYRHWLIRPVLNHLRLALNSRDMKACEGVLLTLYIAKEKGASWIREKEKKKAKKWPLIHLMDHPDLKENQKEKLMERLKMIKSLQAFKPEEAIRQIRIKFYDAFIDAYDPEPDTQYKETLKEMLNELETSARRFTGLEEFLGFVDRITDKYMVMESLKKEDESDALKLMTIHRSKGLEFPVVYLIGVSERVLPHSTSLKKEGCKDNRFEGEHGAAAALEEERRLAYVAVTRAKEELYISSPGYYRGKQAHVSRFILQPFESRRSRVSNTAQPVPASAAKKPSAIQDRSMPEMGNASDKKTVRTQVYTAGYGTNSSQPERKARHDQPKLVSPAASVTSLSVYTHTVTKSLDRQPVSAVDSYLKPAPAAAPSFSISSIEKKERPENKPKLTKEEKADRAARMLAAKIESGQKSASPSRPAMPAKPAASSSTPSVAAAKPASKMVPAWVCTDKTCKSWVKMEERETVDRNASKDSPLCKSPMRKGIRSVQVRG
ncbi:UvrD-helicase domain-containing protein [Paenibacillus larvae]